MQTNTHIASDALSAIGTSLITVFGDDWRQHPWLAGHDDREMLILNLFHGGRVAWKRDAAVQGVIRAFFIDGDAPFEFDPIRWMSLSQWHLEKRGDRYADRTLNLMGHGAPLKAATAAFWTFLLDNADTDVIERRIGYWVERWSGTSGEDYDPRLMGADHRRTVLFAERYVEKRILREVALQAGRAKGGERRRVRF